MNTDERLQRYERLFAAGRRSALLDALSVCAKAGAPMPQWVVDAYLRIYDDVLHGRRVDLNDEFGFTLRDPRTRNRRYLIATRGAEVGNAIIAARRGGRPINTELFEEVGEALGLTLRQVRDCWSACRAHLETTGLPLDDTLTFSGLIPVP
mgnify:CR=1 FL=1